MQLWLGDGDNTHAISKKGNVNTYHLSLLFQFSLGLTESMNIRRSCSSIQNYDRKNTDGRLHGMTDSSNGTCLGPASPTVTTSPLSPPPQQLLLPTIAPTAPECAFWEQAKFTGQQTSKYCNKFCFCLRVFPRAANNMTTLLDTGNIVPK